MRGAIAKGLAAPVEGQGVMPGAPAPKQGLSILFTRLLYVSRLKGRPCTFEGQDGLFEEPEGAGSIDGSVGRRDASLLLGFEQLGNLLHLGSLRLQESPSSIECLLGIRDGLHRGRHRLLGFKAAALAVYKRFLQGLQSLSPGLAHGEGMPGFFQAGLEALPHQRGNLRVIRAEGFDLPDQRSLDLPPVGLGILVVVLAVTVIVPSGANNSMRIARR